VGTALIEGQRPGRAESSTAPEATNALRAFAPNATVLGAAAPNFFIVKQSYKAGQEDAFWQWYAEFMKDPVGGTKKMAEHGFMNVAFMATSGGTIFCLWEAKPGKTGEEMQAFVDEFVGEYLNNDVMHLDPKLMLAPPLPSAWGAADDFVPVPKPSYSEWGSTSTWYIVEHTLKLGKEKGWSEYFGSFFVGDVNAKLAALDEANEKAGLNNPTYMSTGPAGPFYCMWEVKPGLSAAYLQSSLDATFGKFLSNTIMRVDTSYGYLLPWASKF